MLLGLQVKAEYIFLRPSPTQPLDLIFSLRFLFLFSFSCSSSSPTFYQPVSFVVHQLVFVLFFYVLLQDVGLSSGIACFRPFSCQFITILLVLSVSLCLLYLAASLLHRDVNMLSCVLCQSCFFTPKCHLQCHLTRHRINLQGCLVGKCRACVSCVKVSEWMIRRMTSFVDECWVCANLF